jgi:hypothetical protein
MAVWRIGSIKPNSAGETWLNLVAPNSGKTRRSNTIYIHIHEMKDKFLLVIIMIEPALTACT